MPPVTGNAPLVLAMLNTVPVGAVGTETVSGTFVGGVLPLYNVDTSAALSDTHQGELELAVSPHALRRLPSWITAGIAAVLETRFVTV